MSIPEFRFWRHIENCKHCWNETLKSEIDTEAFCPEGQERDRLWMVYEDYTAENLVEK